MSSNINSTQVVRWGARIPALSALCAKAVGRLLLDYNTAISNEKKKTEGSNNELILRQKQQVEKTINFMWIPSEVIDTVFKTFTRDFRRSPNYALAQKEGINIDIIRLFLVPQLLELHCQDFANINTLRIPHILPNLGLLNLSRLPIQETEFFLSTSLFPLLPNLHTFQINDVASFTFPAFDYLTQCCTGLTSLNLSSSFWSYDHPKVLSRLTALTELELESIEGPSPAEKLAIAQYCEDRSCSTMFLTGGQFKADALQSIFISSNSLKRLSIPYNNFNLGAFDLFDFEDMKALAANGGHGLESLVLTLIKRVYPDTEEYTILGDKELIALLRSRVFCNLKQLLLGHLRISDVGSRVLASNPMITKLDALHLNDNNRITDEGFQSLFTTLEGAMLSLEDLHLGNCVQLSDASIKYIGSCSSLSHLNIQGCVQITDKALIPILKSCNYIKDLYLDGCSLITDRSIEEGMKHYNESDYTPMLEKFHAINTGIGDEGIKIVCELHGASLTSIHLDKNCTQVAVRSIIQYGGKVKELVMPEIILPLEVVLDELERMEALKSVCVVYNIEWGVQGLAEFMRRSKHRLKEVAVRVMYEEEHQLTKLEEEYPAVLWMREYHSFCPFDWFI